MKFGKALKILKNGQKIYREHWLKSDTDILYIIIIENKIHYISANTMMPKGVWSAPHEDLLANDWSAL